MEVCSMWLEVVKEEAKPEQLTRFVQLYDSDRGHLGD